jgi:undecaprenyl-diphosphatase
MTYFQSLILGVIQGASEFLPISSSGHLVLAPYLFGWDIPQNEAFVFDILVQVATLLAVIIFFWRDLIKIFKALLDGIKRAKPFDDFQSLMGWYLILATIPAGITAVFFKETFEKAFSNPKAAALFLLVTSLLLILGEVLGKRTRSLEKLTLVDALVIGLFQALALFPGISRSGSTIAGGLIRGLDRRSSARFSFLMAVPVMLAAGLLNILSLRLFLVLSFLTFPVLILLIG